MRNCPRRGDSVTPACSGSWSVGTGFYKTTTPLHRVGIFILLISVFPFAGQLAIDVIIIDEFDFVELRVSEVITPSVLFGGCDGHIDRDLHITVCIDLVCCTICGVRLDNKLNHRPRHGKGLECGCMV
ncbi:hypothetical protein ABW19_dt0209959 [Dactylella cylindrospora]|nr:hypothetical protein ABW19_dt0209959 [Dactylella cylindrospora]